MVIVDIHLLNLFILHHLINQAIIIIVIVVVIITACRVYSIPPNLITLLMYFLITIITSTTIEYTCHFGKLLWLHDAGSTIVVVALLDTLNVLFKLMVVVD